MKNWIVCLGNSTMISMIECTAETVDDKVYFKRGEEVVAVFSMNNIAGFYEDSIVPTNLDCMTDHYFESYTAPERETIQPFDERSTGTIKYVVPPLETICSDSITGQGTI